MYNLTVDEVHTYFVGEGQWLVHNDCYDDITWQLKNDENIYKEYAHSSPEHAGKDLAYIQFASNGTVKQIALYDNQGRVVYHIDAPDEISPYWHYHVMQQPGFADSGHTGNHPAVGDGTWEDVVAFMDYSLGFDGTDWITPPD